MQVEKASCLELADAPELDGPMLEAGLLPHAAAREAMAAVIATATAVARFVGRGRRRCGRGSTLRLTTFMTPVSGHRRCTRHSKECREADTSHRLGLRPRTVVIPDRFQTWPGQVCGPCCRGRGSSGRRGRACIRRTATPVLLFAAVVWETDSGGDAWRRCEPMGSRSCWRRVEQG